jgi:hypothetical protein
LSASRLLSTNSAPQTWTLLNAVMALLRGD